MNHALVLGVAASIAMISVIVWSIAVPSRRLWPPQRTSLWRKVFAWLHTILIFACALYLGIVDWNSMALPAPLRWGIGLPMVVAGNAVVWWGVWELGLAATSGDEDRLITDGLYEFSRNPQYVADIGILVGWAILSASFWSLPVVTLGIATLALAPFAEERWLEERYGESYAAYRKHVRRYF